MKYLFTKLSEPGYGLEFNTKAEVLIHLLPRVCAFCELEAKSMIDTNALTAEECNAMLLNELLNTDCGCEYDLEEYDKTTRNT